MSAGITSLETWSGLAGRLALWLPELAKTLQRGSWTLAVLTVAGGVVLLLAGGRFGRFMTATAGGGMGWLVGTAIAPALATWMPTYVPPWVGAVVLATASFLALEVFPLAFGAIPGAIIGYRLDPFGHAWIAALLGASALAGVALLVRRWLVLLIGALAGAVLIAVSLLALSAHVPALSTLAHRPRLLVTVVLGLTAAGTVFQFAWFVAEHRSRKDAHTEGPSEV